MKVKCMVRVRPLSAKELKEGAENCIIAIDTQIAARENQFTYDFAFPSNVEQAEVYAKTVSPMVDKLFDGYHQTVFAYGQTGSGKTFTMGGEYRPEKMDDDTMGIIPRVASAITERIASLSDEYSIKCTVSYFELYMEDIRDLLKPETPTKNLQVREQPDGTTTISDLSHHPVASDVEILQKLSQGNGNRSVGATEMNATSSRSHACFTISLEQQNKNIPEDSKCSMLRLIDLAGSERLKRTKAEGTRKEEGVKINMGLLSLGNVISALSDGSSHISYRDSKLTRILKDSLGGNSHTLMIACVSPADTNFEESLNTLRYADRARKIKNKPIQNRDPVQAELIQLRKELQMLRTSGGKGVVVDIEETDEFQDMKDRLEKELEHYRTALSDSTYQNRQMLLKVTEAEKEREKVQAKIDGIRQQAAQLQRDNLNMTQVGEDLEEDPRAAAAFNALRQLHRDVLEVEHQHKKSRVSFAVMNQVQDIKDFSDIAENSDEDDDPKELNSPGGEKLFQSHKLNDDIHGVNAEIETLEMNLEKMESQNENHFLVKARYESEIGTLKEKIEQLDSEKMQLVRQLSGSPSKKPKDSKLADNRRTRIKELEQQMASLKKDRQEKERLLRDKAQREKQLEKMKSDLDNLKRKKVELVKKAKEEQKRFDKFKQETQTKMKTMDKANRRQKTEMEKMKRQKERIENVLRVKAQQAQASEKKLKELMGKRQQNQAERKRQKNGTSQSELKAQIKNEAEMHIWGRFNRNMIKELKEERAELTRKIGLTSDERLIRGWKKRVKQIGAELASSQDALFNFDQCSSPCSPKSLPLKDVAEARQIIGLLFEFAVENGYENKINKAQADNYHRQVEKLKSELDLQSTERVSLERTHREELTQMAQENQVLEKELKGLKANLSTICSVVQVSSLAGVLDSPQVKAEPKALPKPKKLLPSQTHASVEEFTPLRDFVPDTPIDNEKADPTFDIKQENKRRTHSRLTLNKSEASNSSLNKSQTMCKCKSDCKTKRCRCRAAAGFCADTCGCLASKCTNRAATEPEEEIEGEVTPYSDKRPKLDVLDETYDVNKENETFTVSPKMSPMKTVGDLDVSKVGLGVNRKVTDFTPKRKRLFQSRSELKTSDAARQIKLPSQRHAYHNEQLFLTPKKE